MKIFGYKTPEGKTGTIRSRTKEDAENLLKFYKIIAEII